MVRKLNWSGDLRVDCHYLLRTWKKMKTGFSLTDAKWWKDGRYQAHTGAEQIPPPHAAGAEGQERKAHAALETQQFFTVSPGCLWGVGILYPHSAIEIACKSACLEEHGSCHPQITGMNCPLEVLPSSLMYEESLDNMHLHIKGSEIPAELTCWSHIGDLLHKEEWSLGFSLILSQIS